MSPSIPNTACSIILLLTDDCDRQCLRSLFFLDKCRCTLPRSTQCSIRNRCRNEIVTEFLITCQSCTVQLRLRLVLGQQPPFCDDEVLKYSGEMLCILKSLDHDRHSNQTAWSSLFSYCGGSRLDIFSDRTKETKRSRYRGHRYRYNISRDRCTLHSLWTQRTGRAANSGARNLRLALWGSVTDFRFET